MKLYKYNSSTYKDVLITSIEIDDNDSDTSTITFYSNSDVLGSLPLNISYDESKQYSADYLICLVQDDSTLNIQK